MMNAIVETLTISLMEKIKVIIAMIVSKMIALQKEAVREKISPVPTAIDVKPVLMILTQLELLTIHNKPNNKDII